MNFKDLIKEICEEENIKVSFLSKGWITVLEKNKKVKIVVGNKFDLNGHGLGLACDDKYALYELLKHFNLPIVEHNIVYSSNNNAPYAKECNSFSYIKDLFLKYNKAVVLKDNNGSLGVGVYYITDEKDLENKYFSFVVNDNSYSLCPFIEIENEYRVIILNGEPEFIYKKELPIVYGDGKKSIKELLMDFNYEYFKSYDKDNKDVIIGVGEKFVYNWKFNLAGGARLSLDIQNDIKEDVLELAKIVAKKIGVKFVSIDIIRTSDNKYLVLEINSGVMLNKLIMEAPDGYNIAKRIYRKAVLELFKD